MAQIKPSLAKGTRDFSPEEMERRNYIFRVIKKVFKKYGYQEIQTPSFENLSTLTGKYGEEGDKLIFKILNSGDFISKISPEKYAASTAKSLTPLLSEKALRYDLTVPFARYVVMHQNEINLPFKRFQMQPVWRADRPQRGRYREFYQCDVDVIGSESLINEAEFILIYHESLANLGLTDFHIKINNRKILAGFSEIIGKPHLLIDLTVAIDKLDKIGVEGVIKEMEEKGFNAQDISIIRPIIDLTGTNQSKIETLKKVLAHSEIGKLGIQELETVLRYAHKLNRLVDSFIEVDITLARGLNYYTGSIFEVKTNEANIGSIGGGGRYDDLTGMFGLKGLTGVGISFGADRIYDVLLELNLFPENTNRSTEVLITNFDIKAEDLALDILQLIRSKGFAAEFYPTTTKLKKQLAYADNKMIPFVILLGQEELETGLVTLRNMKSGEQQKLSKQDLLTFLIKNN
ncbi:histidine--tRNA ligase [Olivibacter domesticus]|uniref:Histidine--tRNA ligase n=1 Tax=Olivibacter domesticus TaxID=407022 RepID=A0A1H7S6Q4_OLID1|nr:histidine--tRNA ligase [Olivibacter domesticus]SEL67906.1 histidyl-tRNA synthetase [Olivibacter domesticus]